MTVKGMTPVRAMLLMVIGCAWAVSGEAAQLDPRDIRPTEIRLADWLSLRGDDRRMLMIGFGIGWQGETPELEPEAANAVADEFTELDLQLTKLANSGNSARARIATALTRAQLLGRLPFVAVTGGEWIELPMRHRLMMLHGIVAGVYSRAVWETIGRVRDSRSIDDGLAQALRMKRPRLAADPLLLLSWLTDHLSEDAAREQALVTGLASVTRQLGS